MSEIKVLYVGDSSANIGKLFFQTPFFFEMKELDVVFWGQPLKDALEKDGGISVTHMPGWVAYQNFPSRIEELRMYDVVILSDVQELVILLYPQFFPRYPEKPIVVPNRVHTLIKFVEEGGGFLMCGGWLSFCGRIGEGGWHKTDIVDILPVKLLENDDTVETPEGAYVKAVNKEHPIMRNITWDTIPPFLGYNRTLVRDEGEVLAVIGKREDPFIAVRHYGKGRTMIFASDPVLHWGYNFINWPEYSKFWIQVIKWLAGKLE